MTTKKEEVKAGPKEGSKTNPLPKGEEKGGIKSPYEIVVMGEAAKRFKNNMWEGLAHQAELSVSDSVKKGVTDTKVQRVAFEDLMLEGEKKYMKQYHGKNPEAKNKMGVWCYRAFLPSSYRTAKSVAVNCIEQGVSMLRGDEVVGKTACEELYKAKQGVPAKVQEPVKTPWEKWEAVMGTVDKLLVKLDDEEFSRAIGQLRRRGTATRVVDTSKAK